MSVRILVPLDDSQPSRECLGAAINVARLTGAELTLFHAVDTGAIKYKNIPDFQVDMIRERAAATGRILLAGYAAEATAEGLSPRLVQVEGDPDTAVCQEADRGYDFIMMGARVHSDLHDLIFGSISSTLIHNCDRPILMVKQGASRPLPITPPMKALVAVDDSASSARCIGFLNTFDGSEALALTLAHIVSPEERRSIGEGVLERGAELVANQRRALERSGYKVQEQLVVEGEPSEKLCELFSSQNFDIMIVGKPHMGELKERVNDSVCHSLFHSCKGLQMIVP